MSFLDDLLGKLAPSPSVETALSAIPQLLGAYESARGRPIGAPLSMLGQFGDINAKYREKKGDVNALTQLAGSYSPQTSPIAAGQYQALQPLLNGMSPDMAEKQLESVEGTAQAEAAKNKPLTYFNKDTNSFEEHDPLMFPNGQIPPNLIPPTQPGLINKLLSKQMGLLSGSEKEKQTMWDTHSQSKFGMPFAKLRETNPAAADQVIQDVAKFGPDAALQNRETMLPLQMNAELDKQRTLESERPRDRIGLDILRETGLTPAQYQALPGDEKDKIRKNVIANEAREDAERTTATSDARGKVAEGVARQKWLDTPLMKSGFFAVDPKTFEMKMSPEDTIQTASDKNFALVPKSFQNGFQQGASALAGLDALNQAGKAVLPENGGSIPTTALKVDAQYMLGNKDAATYKAQKLNLIPLLRTLAGTSRPNQKEIDLAVKTLQNVANQQQLQSAVGVAQRAVRKALGNMMTVGASQAKADRKSAESSAALSAITGTPASAAPDPGYSVSY